MCYEQLHIIPLWTGIFLQMSSSVDFFLFNYVKKKKSTYTSLVKQLHSSFTLYNNHYCHLHKIFRYTEEKREVITNKKMQSATHKS